MQQAAALERTSGVMGRRHLHRHPQPLRSAQLELEGTTGFRNPMGTPSFAPCSDLSKVILGRKPYPLLHKSFQDK